MSGVPVQCDGCPPDQRCCQLDFIDDEDDDRTWEEWFWEIGFNAVMWVVVIGLAIGAAGLSFFAGMWGFVSGLALLR
jgi:hypothetical protein